MFIHHLMSLEVIVTLYTANISGILIVICDDTVIQFEKQRVVLDNKSIVLIDLRLCFIPKLENLVYL